MLWSHTRLTSSLIVLLLLSAGCGTSAAPAQPAHSAASQPPLQPSGHLELGSIRYSSIQIQHLQARADAGKAGAKPYRNPIQSLVKTLPNRGFDRDASIYPPLQMIVAYRHRQYDVVLNQPVRRGPRGIWVIYAVVPHRGATLLRRRAKGSAGAYPLAPSVHLGLVKQSLTRAEALQQEVNRGIGALSFYRNPVQVVRRKLPSLGFLGRFRIEPRVTARIMERDQLYEATLTQPAQRGLKGIWLVSDINAPGASEHD